jgi:hypothetical protein
MMSELHNAQLSSTEMALIWTTYMQNSMSLQVLSHYKLINQSPEIEHAIQQSLELSQNTEKNLQELLQREQIPIPHGFSQADLNANAPRLYSDTYTLRYLKHMTKMGLATYSLAMAASARPDVLTLFKNNLQETARLHELNTNILLDKGVYVRPPILTKPDKVEYVVKQGFLDGFLGHKRPLTAVEISHLSINIENNLIGSVLLTGFGQTAQSSRVREFMTRGKEIGTKHAEIFRKHLVDDEIASPSVWDSNVERSTIPPFSDKLMMFHANGLIAFGVGNYGLAIAACLRNDLVSDYMRLMAEVLKYAEDGANIMIDEGWMEQPPQAPNYHELAHR